MLNNFFKFFKKNNSNIKYSSENLNNNHSSSEIQQEKNINFPNDIPLDDQIILKKIIKNNLTMTSINNILCTYFQVMSILRNSYKGDFIETGTWAGGHAILMGYLLSKYNSNKKIFIFDTFSGMPKPMSNEVRISDNVKANTIINQNMFNKCIYSLADLEKNIKSFGLNLDRFFFVKGKTQDTLKKFKAIKHVAFVRMDTDWYESTKAEIEFFWPKLIRHGVVIIDDYAYWSGQKRAIDEYFSKKNDKKSMHYVDHGTRLFMKL